MQLVPLCCATYIPEYNYTGRTPHYLPLWFPWHTPFMNAHGINSCLYSTLIKMLYHLFQPGCMQDIKPCWVVLYILKMYHGWIPETVISRRIAPCPKLTKVNTPVSTVVQVDNLPTPTSPLLLKVGLSFNTEHYNSSS